MKKIFANFAVRVTALVVLFAMIAAIILYQAGAYDVSFIKRPIPAPDTEIVTDGTSSETSGNDVNTTFPDNTTVLDTETFESETTISGEDSEKILDTILSLTEMNEKGWKVSKNAFGEASSIARLDFSFGKVQNTFKGRKKTVKRKYVYQNKNGYYVTKTETKTVTAPAVTLYYGLIILDRAGNYSVWNADGKQLIKKFSGTLVYACTSDGSPVVMIKDKYYFIDREDGLSEPIDESAVNFHAVNYDSPEYYAKNTSIELFPYCEYVDVYTEITTEPLTTEPPTTAPSTTPSDTSFGSSEPEDTVPDTSADTEEPKETEPDSSDISSEPDSTEPDSTSKEEPSESSSNETEPDETDPETLEVTVTQQMNEAEASEETTVIKDGKLYKVESVLMWGYRDGMGNTVIEPQFRDAYGFTDDGLAAVVDFEGRVSFIDETGKMAVSLVDKEEVRYHSTNKTKVRQSFLEPVSGGKDAIGMYYFDRGYAMVRFTYRHLEKTTMYLSENRLVSKDGKYVELPSTYELLAYSDGIMLLHKNGSYGYMDLEGGWVLPPVFSSASPFIQGLAVVSTSDGRMGLVNTDGEYVLPLCFDYVSDASSGYVTTFSEERGWEIYCVVEKAA